MRRSYFALALVMGLTACGGSTPTDPSASPSPTSVEVSPAPSPTPDPCAVVRLSLNGFIGNTPVLGVFPLNQGVTIIADYVDADQEAAAAANCPNIRSVDLWALKDGYGDLFGDQNSATAVLFAYQPGNFIVAATAQNRDRSATVNGEWKARAKFEGQQFSVNREAVRAMMLADGYQLVSSR